MSELIDVDTLDGGFSAHLARPAGVAEPPMGAHIVTPRLGYFHHGIYVGDGRVVHYAGWAHGIRRAPVEEVTLGAFANGREIWVSSDAPALFDCCEVIARARSRLGENCYRLLTNNCKQFCEWCRQGDRGVYEKLGKIAGATVGRNDLARKRQSRLLAWKNSRGAAACLRWL